MVILQLKAMGVSPHDMYNQYMVIDDNRAPQVYTEDRATNEGSEGRNMGFTQERHRGGQEDYTRQEDIGHQP